MSVGHIARAAELAGIATVIISADIFEQRLAVMNPPRTVLTPYPMGRPLGQAGNAAGQKATLLAGLRLLAEATEGGSVLRVDHPYC